MWMIEHAHPPVYGFCRAFRFKDYRDLSSFSLNLNPGIALCLPKYIAGSEHVRRILVQASEYWKRETILARKRSIDLLMRITCQSQIASALKLCNISCIKQIAMFGLVQSASDVELLSSDINSLGGFPADDLLRLTSVKKEFLSKFHNLPEQCNTSQLIDYLEEKSVLLVFSK